MTLTHWLGTVLPALHHFIQIAPKEQQLPVGAAGDHVIAADPHIEPDLRAAAPAGVGELGGVGLTDVLRGLERRQIRQALQVERRTRQIGRLQFRLRRASAALADDLAALHVAMGDLDAARAAHATALERNART